MAGDAIARVVGDERGGILPLFAFLLPVLVLFAGFVIDVGNWFVHHRHVQLQADAGALAGGGAFGVPCSDDPILSETRKYAGDPNHPAPYNLQIGGIDQKNVHVLINSDKFWNHGGTDYSDGTPCAAKMVDVKITEADLPWLFDVAKIVPAINAHARVQIKALESVGGLLPVGVPDGEPRVARATFIDEATGTVLATTELKKTGTAGGLGIWENKDGLPVSVPISASRIGVRIALGGGTSTTCGERFVECYDHGSANGIVYVRGWSADGSGAQPNPPLARSVRLFPGASVGADGSTIGCSDPYFSSASSTCTIGVAATVDFGGDPAAVGAKVTAVIAGVEKPLTYDTGTGEWVSAVADELAISSAAGPLRVEVKWEETTGTVNGNTCTTGGGNKCKGTFGTVQRSFSATVTRSGPIKLAQVSDSTSVWANSLQRGTTQGLFVKIGVAGKLKNAESVNEPLVELRVTGGSQNQSVDCDPKWPNLRDELANGCRPFYTENTGTPCPANADTLWKSPEPWTCVALQTGGAVGQVPQGMNDRINDGTNTCLNPSRWQIDFPNFSADDPRIVPVFLTPFASFQGSGNDVVPVTGFGSFYVTGYDGSPCKDDDPVPDKGYIVGHFFKEIYQLNQGGAGEELCDFNSFESCIAILTD